MLVLGIESTCDETGIALVSDGREILANCVASQAELHAPYGGVFPELACRRHIDLCVPLLDQALHEAGVSLEEVDLIAVAHAPGLIGALLIGVHFAKGLAFALNKPLVGVNHIEAHLYASIMEEPPLFPALGAVLSGGHTSLYKIEALGKYLLIGQTQDDAVGEAFDKVATLLGLSYPGGPEIERAAKEGESKRYPFKGGRIKGRPFDFSFSGLKTAVLYTVKGQNGIQEKPPLSQRERADIAASFQHAACMDIVDKMLLAAKEYHCQSFLLGGGVTNNRYLRQLLAEKSTLPIYWPPPGLTLDNAAMIAGLGYHLVDQSDSLDLRAYPRLPLRVA